MIVLLANITKLINFSFVENEATWWWHYIHADTGEMLQRIDYSDLVDYMEKYYGGCDVKVGDKCKLVVNGKIYEVVQVSDHQYKNRRVTKIIII